MKKLIALVIVQAAKQAQEKSRFHCGRAVFVAYIRRTE